MTGRGARPLVTLGLLLALGGCAAVAPQPEARAPASGGPSWVERLATLRGWDRFEAHGRLSSAEMRLRGDFRWTQLGAEFFDLRLSGPLGAGAVALRGTPSAIEVRSREGTQYTADPELWLQHHLGWSLPVARLRHWILGIPAPGFPAELAFDAQGRLARLRQDGWTLTYAEYAPAAGLDLPRRLDATNGSVSLRLLVDRWTPPITQARRPTASGAAYGLFQ